MQNDFLSNYIIKPDGTVINRNTNRALKHYIMRNGYHQVTLYDMQGHNKKFLVHRLVATVYLPNGDNLPQVNHIDLNKDNNSVDNLEWCDALHNLRHARAHGVNIYTPERNAKISKARKGISRSADTRRKISATMIKNGTSRGANHPLYGKHLSADTIAKRTHSRYHKHKKALNCPYCQVTF